MNNCAADTQETGLPESAEKITNLLAPRPVNLQDTGLSDLLVADLLIKHLYEGGVLDLGQLSERLALAGSILQDLLAFLREEGQVEVRGRCPDSGALRYALTDRGRSSAAQALQRDGYIGPAPVPLDQYEKIIEAQSVKHCQVTRDEVHAAFADTVIREALLDQLGPALHSGKAIFIYGDAGTGKSFISRRLARLLGDHVLVPSALAVKDNVIQYFDPSYHRLVNNDDIEPTSGGIHFSQGHDPRYRLCQRPVVITGGELTLDMLELRFEAATKRYRAPLQLLANNGLMLIDDLGRQRVEPVDLFNRWIIPLEDKQDFLVLQSGQHISVPFDVALAFSTNIDPLQLADEAFLRRIGYKIRFEVSDRDEYRAIWKQLCEARGLGFDEALLNQVFEELYAHNDISLLPCHPRDLFDLAQDYGHYHGRESLSPDALRWAWTNYFVNLKQGAAQDE